MMYLPSTTVPSALPTRHSLTLRPTGTMTRGSLPWSLFSRSAAAFLRRRCWSRLAWNRRGVWSCGRYRPARSRPVLRLTVRSPCDPPLPPPSQFFSSLHRHRCQSLNSVWLPYQVVKALPPTEESDSRFFVSAGGSTFTVWSLTASMELAFEKLQLPVAPAAAGRPPTVAIAALGQSRWAFGSILVSHSTAGAGAAHSTTPAAHRLQCGGCSARND